MDDYRDAELSAYRVSRGGLGVIDHGTARTIANLWMDGSDGPNIAFGSSGAIGPETIEAFTTDRRTGANLADTPGHALLLRELRHYIMAHGDRGPVDGWPGVWVDPGYYEDEDEAVWALTHDENGADTSGLSVPCSVWGHDSESCAPVAWRIAEIHSLHGSGDPVTFDDIDGAMSLVVNDHDGIAELLRDHGDDETRERYRDEIRDRAIYGPDGETLDDERDGE